MYCQECGKEISSQAIRCPGCGAVTNVGIHGSPNRSSKKYVVAVALSGIFGVVGVHHFYLGNILHGAVDMGMLVIGVACIAVADTDGDGGLAALGALILIADLVHTLIVTYRLIVGKQRDGQGRLVLPPTMEGTG